MTLSELRTEYNSTLLPGCVTQREWHLSFVEPFEWTEIEKMEFSVAQEEVIIDGYEYQVYMEYAVLRINRPWFHTRLFKERFRHDCFQKDEISNGAGAGFLPYVNTGMIVTKKIVINELYNNNKYQIAGWIVKRIPNSPVV